MTILDLLNKYSNIILIDLSWVLYRSHFAFKDLHNSTGELTGQYYGLSNLLKQLTTSYPDHLILLIDDGNPVERKELNESYKANRDHSIHFSNKKHIVDCLIQYLPNVFRVYNPIAEADDLIFSISRSEVNNFIIYSTDKDLYQALKHNVKISSTIKNGKFILKDTLSDSYINNFKDLEPFQIPYYRAVLGDPSDNLKIIRPRFPSKVAYYFAKNYVYWNEYIPMVKKPESKPDELTETQYECLLEIYSNPNFISNLKIMQLSYEGTIPIVEKNKTFLEVQEVLINLELHQFTTWLQSTKLS